MKRFQSDWNGSPQFPGLPASRRFLAGCFSFRVAMSTGLGARFFGSQLDHQVGQMVKKLADMMADMKCGKSPRNQGFLPLQSPTWPT